jgi:hypothetical protein
MVLVFDYFIFSLGAQLSYARKQIIAKNEWLHGDGESGEDVVRHVITTMIWP